MRPANPRPERPRRPGTESGLRGLSGSFVYATWARGAMGPNSDVDLLVVKAGANRLDLMGEICRNLHGVGEPVDVIVPTPEDLERYRNSRSPVFAPALREGRVVYAA